MSYVLTYTILFGRSTREAPNAAVAFSELLAIKLAGAINIVIRDAEGRLATARDLSDQIERDEVSSRS